MQEYPAKAKISFENGTIEVEGSESLVKDQLQHFESKLSNDIVKGNKFEILKMKYKTHAKDLQFRKNFSFKLCYSFVILSLSLFAWLKGVFTNSVLPKLIDSEKWLLSVFMVSLSITSCWILFRDSLRRKDIVMTLQNIARAFKFNEEDIYFKERIDPETSFSQPRFWDIAYIFVISMITILLLVVIWKS